MITPLVLVIGCWPQFVTGQGAHPAGGGASRIPRIDAHRLNQLLAKPSLNPDEAYIVICAKFSNQPIEKPLPLATRTSISEIANRVRWGSSFDYDAFGQYLDRCARESLFGAYKFRAQIAAIAAVLSAWDALHGKKQVVFYVSMLACPDPEASLLEGKVAPLNDLLAHSYVSRNWPWRKSGDGKLVLRPIAMGLMFGDISPRHPSDDVSLVFYWHRDHP